MAMTPLPGVGGTLFAGGGGVGGIADPTTPVQVGGGKNSHAQNLGSPYAGTRSTITKGEPLSRAMGQYGKGHSFTSLAGGGAQPLGKVRGGLGQMKRIRGGLGPGKTGQAGPSNDYSMTSPDTE
jgi:hypothetical protein